MKKEAAKQEGAPAKDSEECRKCMAGFAKKEEEYRKRIEELVDTMKRVQAEFENYRKMCERDNADFRKYADARMIADLLPIIDTFEIALSGCKGDDEFSKGIRMIRDELHSLMKKKGLKQIECIGKKFDPYYHEVMMCIDTDKDEGVVLEELQRGYMLHDKVLRHSKVKVSRKKARSTKQAGGA